MNTTTLIIAALIINAAFIFYFVYSSRRKNKFSAEQSMNELKGQIQTVNQNFFSYLESKDKAYIRQFETITAVLNKQVADMAGQMFNTRDVFDKRLEQNGRVLSDLQRSLGEITQLSQRIFDVGRDVAGLQDVLRAPKLRGVLGETFLEELLSEILPAEYFKMQYTFAGGEVVDAAIFLRGKVLAVDSKFPLENFKKSFSAESEDSKNQALKKLALDVKKHIDAVSSKYIKPSENTFDCAFMYIPAENVYYELFIKDTIGSELNQYAFRKKVINVSPNTIHAYLQLIIFGLKGIQIEENARKVLEYIISLKDTLLKFSDEFDTLGRHILNTSNKYEESHKRLEDFSLKLKNLEHGSISASDAGKLKIVD